MMEFLDAPEGVFAVRCGGRLDHAEMEECLVRLRSALDANARTHVFAEVVDIGSVSAESFVTGFKWAPEWLSKLDRFGRVAIVADQSWVRWAAKIESALLPHISYETFESDERERAFAWVAGEIEAPHPPAIKLIETDNPDVFGFEIDGHAAKHELDAVSAHFLKALEGKDRVRVVGRIRRLGGFQMAGLFSGDYFAMKRGFLEKLDRYAVVGGPAWLRSTLNSLAPLFRAEVRHFELDDEVAAWQWVEARPVSERYLVP
jgi:hypothetical protein